MARVSQAHLDARRRQILDAALRCFNRNGFHATSMQDILREANLSAGAVYRYFRGKEELIAASAAEVLGTVRTAFEAAAAGDPPPPPDQVLGAVLRTVYAEAADKDDPRALPRLVIQVWSETLRNEKLAASLLDGYNGLRQGWAHLVEAYQKDGLMRADTDPDHVARTMIGMVQGFLAQQALFGHVGVEVLEDGIRALMSMDGRATADGGVNATEKRAH